MASHTDQIPTARVTKKNAQLLPVRLLKNVKTQGKWEDSREGGGGGGGGGCLVMKDR